MLWLAAMVRTLVLFLERPESAKLHSVQVQRPRCAAENFFSGGAEEINAVHSMMFLRGSNFRASIAMLAHAMLYFQGLGRRLQTERAHWQAHFIPDVPCLRFASPAEMAGMAPCSQPHWRTLAKARCRARDFVLCRIGIMWFATWCCGNDKPQSCHRQCEMLHLNCRELPLSSHSIDASAIAKRLQYCQLANMVRDTLPYDVQRQFI